MHGEAILQSNDGSKRHYEKHRNLFEPVSNRRRCSKRHHLPKSTPETRQYAVSFAPKRLLLVHFLSPQSTLSYSLSPHIITVSILTLIFQVHSRVVSRCNRRSNPL